jgi:DNA-binding IclR family transcriptional regulator
VTIPPGTSVPLPSDAFGKALLAFAPPEVLDEVLSADAEANGVDADRLRKELAEIVTGRIATSIGEPTPGIVALAVPVFREDGIVAAIGVAGPEIRCGPAWRRRVTRLLPSAASSIVEAL